MSHSKNMSVLLYYIILRILRSISLGSVIADNYIVNLLLIKLIKWRSSLGINLNLTNNLLGTLFSIILYY